MLQKGGSPPEQVKIVDEGDLSGITVFQQVCSEISPDHLSVALLLVGMGSEMTILSPVSSSELRSD